jgi:hypothetical protein
MSTMVPDRGDNRNGICETCYHVVMVPDRKRKVNFYDAKENFRQRRCSMVIS